MEKKLDYSEMKNLLGTPFIKMGRNQAEGKYLMT